jgi:hypothetical protein
MDTCLCPFQVFFRFPFRWQADPLPNNRHRKRFQSYKLWVVVWAIRKFGLKFLPVIILTFTPRLSALLIVSALSCLGGSNNGNRPTNCHGPPGLSFVLSGTSCYTNHTIQAVKKFFQSGIKFRHIDNCYHHYILVLQHLKIEVHAPQTYQLLYEPFSWHLLCSCRDLLSKTRKTWPSYFP